MSYLVALPDGTNAEFPDNVTPEEAARVIAQQFPPSQEKGLLAGLKKGAEQLVSSGVAGAQALTGDATEAGRAASERSKSIASRYAEQTGLKRLEDVYQQEGLFGGAKELARQVPLVLAEQAPNLAAMAGGARLGAMAGTPFGPYGAVVGAGVGALAPSVLQQLGGNVERQVETEPNAPVNMGRAVPTALAQGTLDLAAGAIPLGRTIVGKLLGPGFEKMLAAGATKQAEKLAVEKLPALLAKGTATGVAVETPTEVTQQMLERWQAGQPLFSDDALREYSEAAYSATLLGPLGAAGRYADRGAARTAVAEKGKADAAAAAEAARQAELNAPTPFTELTKPTELDTSPARPTNEQLWAQHDAAEAAKVQAHQDMQTALKTGDFDAVEQHQQAFADAEKAQQDVLSRITEARPEPVSETPAAPDITAKSVEELQATLLDLQQGKANAKGKRSGISPILQETDPQIKAQLIQQGKAIQAELKRRQDEADAAARPGQAVSKAIADFKARETTSQMPERPVPGAVAEPATPVHTAEDAAAWLRNKRQEAQVDQDVSDMQAARMNTAEEVQPRLFGEQEQNKDTVQAEDEIIQRIQTARREKDNAAAAIAIDQLRQLRMKRFTDNLLGERPEQHTPFPSLDVAAAGAARPVELPESAKTGVDVSSGAAATQENLRKQIAALPRELDPYAEQLVGRLNDNLSAFAVNPERAQIAQDWLYRLRTGTPDTSGRVNTYRSEEIRNMLDDLEQGKRSETEQLKFTPGQAPLESPIGKPATEGTIGLRRAVQRDIFPEIAPARTFNTPAQFAQYLGGEALHKMRTAMGSTVQTVARAFKRVAPLRDRLERLEQSLTDAQAAYARHRDSYAGLTENAQIAHDAAKTRLEKVARMLEAEREPMVIEYLKAQQALKFSADVSRDITKAMLDNKAMLHSSLPSTIEALVREKQGLSDTIGAQMEQPKGKTPAEQAKHVTLLQEQIGAHQQAVNGLLKELEGKRAAFPDVFNKYLQKERSYQKQLSTELATMQKLHKAFSEVKERFDRLEKNQNRRVTVQRERAAAQDEIRKTGTALEATNRASEAGRKADVAEIERAQEAKVSGTKDINERIRQELGPVEAARDARLPKAPAEETREEREARSGERTRAEQARLEQHEAGAGEIISFRRQRAMRDFLADAPDKLKLLERARDNLPDGAQRNSVITRINRVKRLQETYKDRMSASNEALARLDERIAKKREQVADIKQRLAEKHTASRRDQLTEAQKELAGLMQSRAGNRGIDVEPVRKEALADEAVAPGERLMPRKIGPLVKKAVNPPGTRNPIRQEGRPKGVTAHQAVLEGNRVSAELQSQKELAEQQREEARIANEEAAAARQRKAEAPEKADTSVQKKAPKKAKTSRTIEEIETEYEDNYYDPSGFGSGWEGEHENVLFRSDAKAPAGMDVADVQSVVDAVTKGWKNAPDVVVVQNEAALPLRIQGRVRLHKENGAARVPGLYDSKSDKVYLLADDIRGAHDAQLTIMHEVAGHRGLRGLLGDAYAETMQRLAAGNKDVAEKARRKMDEDPKITHEIAVEEVLADMAETNPEYSSVKRFFYAIKQALFKAFGIKNVSDNEVKQLVANARRFIERGPGGGPKGGGDKTLLRSQPAQNAAEAFGRQYTDERGKLAKLNAAKSHLPLAIEQAVVDMRASLRRALMLGDTKLGTQALYDLSNTDDLTSMVRAVLSNGGFKIGKDTKNYDQVTAGHTASFVDVTDAISDIPGRDARAKTNTFYGGMMALRGTKVGWDKLNYDNPAQAERDGRAALAAINADPEMKAAFDKAQATYNEFNRGLVQFAKDTHALPEDIANAMLADKEYVPFYRVNGDSIEVLMPDGHPVSLGDIRSQPFLHSLVGGDQKLMPFEDAVFKNAGVLTALAMRNLSSKRIAYALQDLGKGAKVMQIQYGKGGAGQDVMRFRQAPDANRKDDDGWRHIVIDTKGTAAEYIPTDLLAQSVAGSYATLPSFLKVAGWASDVLRAGVTRMPTYVLSQTIKDPFNAAMLGNLKSNPIAAVAKTIGNFGGNLTGKSADAQALTKMGVLHSQVFNGTPDDMKKVYMQMAGKSQGTFSRFMAGLDHVAMTADAATREQHYRDVLNAGGSEVEAALGAREMQNFTKRGSSSTVQMITRMIPFFNAQIQGLNVMAKSARGKMGTGELLDSKSKFYTRAMGMAGMSLAYAMMMDDDPDWQKMALRDKVMYLHAPKWMSPGDEPLRFPAPFESGMAFYSLPVAMVEAWRKEFSPEDWKVVRELFASQLPGNGSIMPQIAKGVYDVKRNYNTGTGLPIEPKGLEHLSPEERFTQRTTEAAKAMSRHLVDMGVNLSPMQIEYLSNAYLAQLPHVIAVMTNQLFADASKGERPTGHSSDMPLFGRFFQSDRVNDDVSHVYEQVNASLEAKATFNKKLKDGRTADALAYMEEHKMDIALAPTMQHFQTQLRNLTKAEQAITNSPDIGGQEKQDRLDRIREAKQKIAKQYRAVSQRVGASIQ